MSVINQHLTVSKIKVSETSTKDPHPPFQCIPFWGTLNLLVDFQLIPWEGFYSSWLVGVKKNKKEQLVSSDRYKILANFFFYLSAFLTPFKVSTDKSLSIFISILHNLQQAGGVNKPTNGHILGWPRIWPWPCSSNQLTSKGSKMRISDLGRPPPTARKFRHGFPWYSSIGLVTFGAVGGVRFFRKIS